MRVLALNIVIILYQTYYICQNTEKYIEIRKAMT